MGQWAKSAYLSNSDNNTIIALYYSQSDSVYMVDIVDILGLVDMVDIVTLKIFFDIRNL